MSNTVKVTNNKPPVELHRGDIIEHICGPSGFLAGGEVEHYILARTNGKYVAVCLQDGLSWAAATDTVEQATEGMNICAVFSNCDIQLCQQPV